MATVEVWLADLEPVATFIVKAVQAERALYHLSKDEACALPGGAVKAMAILQGAVRDLGDHVPAEAAALMGKPQVVEHPA